MRYRTRGSRRPDVGVNTLYNLMNDGFALGAGARVDELTGDRPILRVAQTEGTTSPTARRFRCSCATATPPSG
ncbi:hypothetical protein [Frankia sp. AgB32]|uniref:hypothetical protein n=1 Tax=Frankia sp. AgB32 TaxID=631119 RepID=UPI00201006C1|nr:hypothetical protein [Frankia sp. AgB32]MCK9894495.1 hypothetical protein [Frankia sp. AgB32]